MIEIHKLDDDEFRIVMETLTRMGVAKTHINTLYQTCHIVNIDNRFYIIHYKEIEGILLEDIDYSRTNTIAVLLENWGRIKIKDTSLIDEYGTLMSIFIVPYKKKKNWNLVSFIDSTKIKSFIIDKRS